MPGNARVSIAEHPQEQSLLIRCEGRCTMSVCPTIRATIDERAKPPLRHIYIDLRQTEAIDSTFTGFLLALRRDRSNPAAPALHLVAPSPDVMRSLETMQVQRLLDVVDALPEGSVDWTPLVTDPLDVSESRNLIIDAHEQLIEADESNREKFGHVVDVFREDPAQCRKDPNA